MRSAGNFSPEWGYLAPAPSFARTARIVLAAIAIGATAGAGVVLSLIDHSAKPEQAPVAARAIVMNVHVAAAPAAPEIGTVPMTPAAAPVSVPAAPLPTSQPLNQPAAAVPSIPANASTQAPAPITPSENAGPANAAPTPATEIAALSEPSATGTAAPADAPDGGTITQEPTPQKKAKHHGFREPFPGLGTLFRRFFVAHAGRSYYPNH
jgi:hypothetical protein